MLKQLILIVPLLVHALAVPAVEPRHQHLHGHIEHTHDTKTSMTTSVRRESEQTAAPQFIPPKMPYALDPNTKIHKTITAAAGSNNPKETVVPEFIPPKMPFVGKASWQKSTKNQDSADKSVSVSSVNKKVVAKVQDEDDDSDKQPTFIPPRAPFRGSRKPQQTQAATPRDTVPQFIPPRNPWAQSKYNTRSTDNDAQDASQETAIPDADQRAARGDTEVVPAPELLKRDEESADNEFFVEDEEDDYSPDDFPNLGAPEDEEHDDSSNNESENTPAGNASEQAKQNAEAANAQDDGNAKNHFGGDFDDEDDANSAPARLEARGIGKRNILYFTNWGTYGANFQPQNLPVTEITHVLYSFAKVNPNVGTVFSSDSYADTDRLYAGDNGGGKNVYGCVKQLYILKKKNRNLKVLLSIGGWNNSPDLATGVSTQARRKKFISSAIKLITDWGFDGIDVDWEYPSNSQEARNYVLILSGLRKALDQYSKDNKLNYHFMLTVATSAGPASYKIMDLKGMNPWIDAWHLMAYDYAGSWDTTTGHQANVFISKKNPLSTKLGTDNTINDYLAAGVPPNKILVGMPLYGRSFLNTAGLGKSYSGVGGNSEGTYLYKDLPQSGAKVTYNADLIATSSYESKKRELVTYDDLKSGQAKASYINQRNLGGAFFWEASGDKVGSQSIVSGVKRTLGTLETVKNLLKYPTSVYDNIRAGMPS
ncbi:endochitinase 1 [Fusarium beomiforme]|uniref:chitinase n=1 Tax=Fusarium beomiforme TaxID=44412 RepID=A0A9P5ATS1_9HYPO|nr:endochitinase 1 [Fusarium beomiforme]